MASDSKLVLLLLVGIFHSQGRPDGSEPSTKYGPPGHTPGEPLGLADSGYGDSGTSTKSTCNNTDPERNKRLVMDFYNTALRDKRPDLMDRFLAEDYLNHNPFSMERGRQDFVNILTVGPLSPEPSQTVGFKRVDAIDDVVWVHCSFNINGKKYAVMDIFQINCDGLMQEHWDVLQDTTNVQTKNPVPFF